MSTQKLIEGFTSLGFAYNIGQERIPASLEVKDGEVLLTLLDLEDNAQKFMEFDSSDLPELIQFHSTKVTVNLFELESLRSSLQLMSRVNTRTLKAGRAVTTASVNNYSDINGVRSRLEGFARWAELSAIEHTMVFPMDENESISSTLVAKAKDSIDLGTRFSLAATSGVQPPRSIPYQQEYKYLDIVSLRSKTGELCAWEEHQRMHRTIQDLMCLAYNYPCELSISEVYREDDQPEHLKDAVRRRWLEAKDSDFGRKRYFEPKKSLDEVTPLFTLKDVSSEKLESWLENFDIWSRATWIAVETIFQPYLAAESRLIQVAIAMEALGYAIWKYEENNGDVSSCGKYRCKGLRKESNPCDKPGCNRPNAAGYFKRIAEKIPFTDLSILPEETAEDWALAFNSVYVKSKHADHDLPDGLEAYRRAKQGLAVIRCWLAKQLGVEDEVLINNKNFL